MKKDLARCLGFGAVALAASFLVHEVAPGLGLALMPMFWPLAALATRVPVGKAAVTAAVVPFVSALLTGMPLAPFPVAVKFAVFAAIVGFVRSAAFRPTGLSRENDAGGRK